jgi:hypothetical protein
MSLAQRALAASDAERQQQQLEIVRKTSERRALALDAIMRAGERFGLEISPSDIHASTPSTQNSAYTYEHQLTPDATLTISMPGYRKAGVDSVEVRVIPVDQLYWDLPPGIETKPSSRGGVYGCYGLDRTKYVHTVADVGARLEAIMVAREKWRKKHGVKS